MFQTPAEKLSTEIAKLSSTLAEHISICVRITNELSDSLTRADNVTLADFLNGRGKRLESDLTEHAITGEALNAAADSATRRLGINMPRVVMSSMADKLLVTKRTATLTETGWVIADIPQPDPEPIDPPPFMEPIDFPRP